MNFKIFIWILAFLLFSSIVLSQDANWYEHNLAMASTAGTTATYGMVIKVNSDFILNATSSGASVSSTNILIYNNSNVSPHTHDKLLVNVSRVSQNTSIPEFTLKAGQFYFICADSDGVSYTSQYSASAGSFNNNSFFNWVGEAYISGASWSGITNYFKARNILALRAKNISSEKQPFVIQASNTYDLSSISNFSVTIKNSTTTLTNSTTTGSLSYTLVTNGLYNISVSSNQSGGFFGVTYSNYNVSTNLLAYLNPKQYLKEPLYSGNISYKGENFIRNLYYSINYTCDTESNASLMLFVNNSVYMSEPIICINSSNLYNSNYTYSQEGNVSVYFVLNSSSFFNSSINTTFKSDLQNPTINNLTIGIINGFGNQSATIFFNCTDSSIANLTYNLTYNNGLVFYGNLSSSNLTNKTIIRSNSNTLIGECSDLFGKTRKTNTLTIYFGQLILIDEMDNVLFNINNASGVRAYTEGNSSFFDFKSEGTNQTNFTSLSFHQIRFEFTYSDGSIINRYIDLNLVENPIRICANKEGVTHYQQLVISATEKPFFLLNKFSNCLVAADYTRFAYQDSLVLQAFSIPALYYLYTFDSDDVQSFLSALDGSISTYINLDQLEFSKTAYNLNLLSDGLSFRKASGGNVQIYYHNIADDNTDINFSITRLDTNQEVFSYSSFVDPNEFSLTFDYSTLSPVVNETVLFRADLIKVSSSGTSTLSRYFNTNASNGSVQSMFAAVISVLASLFGLTLTATRLTFGWFGAIVQLISIAILTFAVATWYITFLLGLNIIIFVFILILLTNKNYPTIS